MKNILFAAIVFAAAFLLAGCKDSKQNGGDLDAADNAEESTAEETEQEADLTESVDDAPEADEELKENDAAPDGDADESELEIEIEPEDECPELELCCVSYCEYNAAVNCASGTGANGCGYEHWDTKDCGDGAHCEKINETAVCLPNGDEDETEDEPSEQTDVESETQASPSLKSHENSECLNAKKKNLFGEDERFEAAYNSETKTLGAAHYNAVFNCCIQTIDVELKTEEFVLSLYEKEIAETPCNCICPYNVVSTIDGLADGEYTVKFYANGNYRGEAKASVGSNETSAKTTFSGCLNGTEALVEEEPAETLSAKSAGGSVEVTHGSARYNCCKETIQTDVFVYGYTIDLFEREITPDPCRCECGYDVETVVGPLAPGVYTINLYKSGKLELSTSVEVSIPRMIREVYCR